MKFILKIGFSKLNTSAKSSNNLFLTVDVRYIYPVVEQSLNLENYTSLSIVNGGDNLSKDYFGINSNIIINLILNHIRKF